MLIKALQRLLAPSLDLSSISKVHRALACIVLDLVQKRARRDQFHHLSNDPTIPVEKIKVDTFTPSTPASLPLTSTPKVGLISFNITQEFGAFQFCNMKGSHPKSLIYPGDGLGIEVKVTGHSIGRLRVIKDLQDFNLPVQQLGQDFFLREEHATNIATRSLYGIKSSTKKHFRPFKKLLTQLKTA